MSPDRWQRLQTVFESARAYQPEDREHFLSKECEGDEDLRRQVQQMLALDASGKMLDTPAYLRRTPVPGELIGPYRIERHIGSGGMGEVFQATDTRLNRSVAMKFSRVPFDARFRREAILSASLNHSNICTLYDVGEDYLVMEFVKGETLSQKLSRGALTFDEILRIVKPVADAVDAAHEGGVVHRDLKPGNIMIRPDGVVKILDFGLAKLMDSQAADESSTHSLSLIGKGILLGTASYMAPEQAIGKTVDERADVYAFGAVLYEMVTGERLHKGETTTEVLASVIKEEPGWGRVPPQFERLLRRCLAKDPQSRIRHLSEAVDLTLEGIADVTARADSGAAAIAIPRPEPPVRPVPDPPLDPLVNAAAAAALRARFWRVAAASVLVVITVAILYRFGWSWAKRSEFEVATVRRSVPYRGAGAQTPAAARLSPPQIRLTYLTMQDFIMRAFGVRAYQVIGPDWLKRERFDISATMPAGATTAQVPAMLQSLLESRFGLKVRKSQQEFEVYVLVRSKRPFTLTEVQPRDAESTTTGVAPTRSGHGVSLKLARGGLFTFADNKLDGKGMSMEMLANTLTPFVALPIVNASDITGFYDIHLDLAPDDYSSMMARAAVSRGVAYPPEVLSKLAGVSNQSFLDSLDEVGLKLETGKRRLEVINVDAVQTTPTEN